MFKRVVPALVGAILLGAVVLGVHYWDPGTPPGADHAGAMAVPPTSGTIRNFTPMNPGRPAPIESFFDAEGRALTLQQFAGKVVLLNLWATWCAPCLKELPSLDRLQAQLGGDRFAVVAVSVDRNGVAAVRPYFEKLKISHLPIYVDSSFRIAKALDVDNLPASVVIGADGLVAGRMIGPAEWDTPEALALLRPYIEQASKVTRN